MVDRILSLICIIVMLLPRRRLEFNSNRRAPQSTIRGHFELTLARQTASAATEKTKLKAISRQDILGSYIYMIVLCAFIYLFVLSFLQAFNFSRN